MQWTITVSNIGGGAHLHLARCLVAGQALPHRQEDVGADDGPPLQPARGHVFCQETGMKYLEVVWILRFIIVVDQSKWSTMINCFCLLCLFVRCANHFSICLFFINTYLQ